MTLNCGFTVKSGQGCGLCDACIEELNGQVGYAIISTKEHFVIAKLQHKHVSKNGHTFSYSVVQEDGSFAGYYFCFEQDVIYRNSNVFIIKDRLAKAKAVEKQLRPMYIAAVEHEARIKNYMLDQVYKAARGENA